MTVPPTLCTHPHYQLGDGYHALADAFFYGNNVSAGTDDDLYPDFPVGENGDYFTYVIGEVPNVPGDFDVDGDVDGDDFLVWQQGFGTEYDGDDFLIWQQNYNPGAASGSAVPEPTTLLLAVVMLCGLAPRRRNGWRL